MPTVYIAGDGPGVGVTAVAMGLATLLEGVDGAPSIEELHPDDSSSKQSAPVLLVSSPTSANPSQAASTLGDRLMGVVVNAVPEHGRHGVLTTTVRSFEERGIPVFGVVPEDRRMLAPTVGDVAEHLGADLINRDDLDDPDEALAALVEHFMLGRSVPGHRGLRLRQARAEGGHRARRPARPPDGGAGHVDRVPGAHRGTAAGAIHRPPRCVEPGADAPGGAGPRWRRWRRCTPSASGSPFTAPTRRGGRRSCSRHTATSRR